MFLKLFNVLKLTKKKNGKKGHKSSQQEAFLKMIVCNM